MKQMQSVHRRAGLEQSSDKTSLLSWTLCLFTITFLVFAAFQRAAFNGGQYTFERPIYSLLVWGSIAIAIVGVKFFTEWQAQSWKNLLQAAVWLIPISYALSLFQAASHHFAVNMLLISCLYALAFLIGSQGGMTKSILPLAVTGSGYIITVFGLMNWFGDASLFGLFNWSEIAGKVSKVYTNAVLIDSNGERLTSVFQYANTYAAYLIGVLLIALHYIVSTRKWLTAGLHGLMLVPILLSFLLTLSRGGIVVFPVVLLLVLPFYKLSRQIMLLVHLTVSAAVSLVLLNPITTTGLAAQKQFSAALAGKGWLILAAGSLAAAALSVLLQRYVAPWLDRVLARWNERKWTHIALPLLAIVAGSIGVYALLGDTVVTRMLPQNIQTRIENINLNQHSVLERATFYQDAMKVAKDYPLLGAGGGAWAALYEKYQNNPYTSRQAHNFYLQYLIEVGIVGFAILAAFLGYIFYQHIRNYFRAGSEGRDQSLPLLIMVAAILVHSALDFNMSYVYIGVLVFLCLGGMTASIEFPRLSWSDNPKVRQWSKLYPAALVVFAIVLFFVSLQLLMGNTHYNRALATASDAPLNKALEYAPNHPEYNVQKLAMLNQRYSQTKDERFDQDIAGTIARLKKKEPFNRSLFEQEYEYLIKRGELQQALELANQGLTNFAWEISVYDRAIALNYQLGMDARENNQSAESEKYWDQAFALYEEVNQRVQLLAQLPEGQNQGREFQVTDNMILALGQIEFVRSRFPEAAELYRLGLTDQLQEPSKKQIARWYLASLMKQGKSDEATYNKLIAADPQEQQYIEGILQSTF